MKKNSKNLSEKEREAKRKTLLLSAMYGIFMSQEREKRSNALIEKLKRHDKHLKRVIPKGCQVYTIAGVTVVALNEKNARRKADKLLKSA